MRRTATSAAFFACAINRGSFALRARPCPSPSGSSPEPSDPVLLCPVVWVVEAGGALALGSEFWSGAVGRVAVVGGVVLLWANAAAASKERRPTATRLRAPLKCWSSICSCQIDENGARPLHVPSTPPIACRSEARGCAFRSRRRSRSSAQARTAARRARRRRSAACRVRAGRCRRWSPAEIHRS